MDFYVGFTDERWFDSLAALGPEEVNFWRPGGERGFNAVDPGELFLFKLKKPNHFFVGGGFFSRASLLPISLAWDAFGEKNGRKSLDELRAAVNFYRKKKGKPEEHDPTIGCVILTSVFFLPRSEWIPAPDNWSQYIVQGKNFSTEEEQGAAIWEQVRAVLKDKKASNAITTGAIETARYGQPRLVTPRMGQGAFRVSVIEAYSRRCAMTGEKTLPALVAAHIKPFAEHGPHLVSNGLLLRSDLHMLFDCGLIGIDENLKIRVSGRIKAAFGNGKQYYALQDEKLNSLPKLSAEQPSPEFLEWHRSNVFQP